MSPGAFRIGTSGYQYDHWVGALYPEDLPKDRWLERYTEIFDTVEINNTFYQLPAVSTFDDWCHRAPEGFLYALKYSRYGSHLKHLKDPDQHVPNFVERARRLEAHLGPILVQLPPQWNVDLERLEAFLETTPADLRWAVEVRNESWLCDDLYHLLERHQAALVIHDKIEDPPRDTPADWVYLRYHGDDYAGSYSTQKLTAEAQQIQI